MTVLSLSRIIEDKFQLTRSRGAWLVFDGKEWNTEKISTHTLTWSVTLTNVHKNKIVQFQLTRSRGAWRTDRMSNYGTYHISTHTLTWSVTFSLQQNNKFYSFQLTRSRGAWREQRYIIFTSAVFQLTRSRGAWRLMFSTYSFDDCISTHTLTWSVTVGDLSRLSFISISTHTLTWSVTLWQTVFDLA